MRLFILVCKVGNLTLVIDEIGDSKRTKIPPTYDSNTACGIFRPEAIFPLNALLMELIRDGMVVDVDGIWHVTSKDSQGALFDVSKKSNK